MRKTKVEIKKAEIADIEILNKISVESKMYWNYPKKWLEYWMAELTLSEQDFEEQSIFKVEESESILGFCAVKESNEQYEITHLWIKPQNIGQGYGSYLLKETLNRVVKKDKAIIVVADPNAEPFYTSRGFETFDSVESYPKGRFLPMMKKLPV